MLGACERAELKTPENFQNPASSTINLKAAVVSSKLQVAHDPLQEQEHQRSDQGGRQATVMQLTKWGGRRQFVEDKGRQPEQKWGSKSISHGDVKGESPLEGYSESV